MSLRRYVPPKPLMTRPAVTSLQAALVTGLPMLTDLFRIWDEAGSGLVSKWDFTQALSILGNNFGSPAQPYRDAAHAVLDILQDQLYEYFILAGSRAQPAADGEALMLCREICDSFIPAWAAPLTPKQRDELHDLLCGLYYQQCETSRVKSPLLDTACAGTTGINFVMYGRRSVSAVLYGEMMVEGGRGCIQSFDCGSGYHTDFVSGVVRWGGQPRRGFELSVDIFNSLSGAQGYEQEETKLLLQPLRLDALSPLHLRMVLMPALVGFDWDGVCGVVQEMWNVDSTPLKEALISIYFDSKRS